MERSLVKSIKKPMPSEEVKSFLTTLRTAWGDRVTIQTSLIIGLPHDTAETVNDWIKWFEDPACPVHNYITFYLNIYEKAKTAETESSFLTDPEKYGYTLYDLNDGEKINSWISKKNWKNEYWNEKTCAELSSKLVQRAVYTRRMKPGMFDLNGLLNIGYTFEYLFNRPMISISRAKTDLLIGQMYNDYITELCDYEGIAR
jgi:hypothetical protein